MKFMTLWTDDWIAGTHPLTPEERGVYITLICHFVNKDRYVADDDIYLARLCNIPTRPYRRIKKTLIDGGFLDIRDSYIWIQKSSDQYTKDQCFSKSQAKKARQKHRFESGNALDLLENISATPSPSPSPSKKDTNVSKNKFDSITPHRIPEDWKPRREEIEWCLELGFRKPKIESMAMRFHTRHLEGTQKKWLRKDFNRAFRNWVLQEIDWNGPPSGATRTKNQIAG